METDIQSDAGLDLSPESQDAGRQDTQASDAAPAPGYEGAPPPSAPPEPGGGEVPSYAQEPTWGPGPSAPAPWQQPSYQPPASGYEGVDWNFLNSAYTGAVTQGIHARYNAIYAGAQTQAERDLIQRAYAADVREVKIREREAYAARREYEAEVAEQERQRLLLPIARRGTAEMLAKKHHLTVDEVLVDRDGNQIWDAQTMALLAREKEYQKYGARVQQRQASGVDQGYRTTGGAGASDEDSRVASMSDAQFAQYWARARSGGAASQV